MEHTSEDIWKIQADIKGRSNFDFFATPSGKYNIYFSNIDEYGMLKFVSPIQIWTDKESPKLIFKSNKIQFEYQYDESCYYLEKSDILVLMTPCYRKEYYDLLYVLLDFNKNSFTIINAPNFRLVELDRNLVQLDLKFRYSYDEQTEKQISKENGLQIDLTKSQWFAMEYLDNVCSISTKNNR